jgi:hypothetical protein
MDEPYAPTVLHFHRSETSMKSAERSLTVLQVGNAIVGTASLLAAVALGVNVPDSQPTWRFLFGVAAMAGTNFLAIALTRVSRQRETERPAT